MLSMFHCYYSIKTWDVAHDFFDFSCSGHYFTEVTGLSAPTSVFSLLISPALASTLPK